MGSWSLMAREREGKPQKEEEDKGKTCLRENIKLGLTDVRERLGKNQWSFRSCSPCPALWCNPYWEPLVSVKVCCIPHLRMHQWCFGEERIQAVFRVG